MTIGTFLEVNMSASAWQKFLETTVITSSTTVRLVQETFGSRLLGGSSALLDPPGTLHQPVEDAGAFGS